LTIDRFTPGGPAFYRDRGFAIGTDAVLLYAFSRDIRAGKIADFGCGSGVIGILLGLYRKNSSITGVEILPEAAEGARANAELNGLSDRCAIITGDIREHRRLLTAGSFDLIVMNPPYYPAGSGKQAKDAATAMARSELACSPEDACRAAAWAVRWGGHFCMVHKPERTAELIVAMHEQGLEPKRLRFAQARADAAPNLVLIDAVRGAAPGLRVEAPLILQKDDGTESDELRAIYGRSDSAGTERNEESL